MFEFAELLERSPQALCLRSEPEGSITIPFVIMTSSPAFVPAPEVRDYVTSGGRLRLRLTGKEWVVHYLGALLVGAAAAAALCFEYFGPPENLRLPPYLATILAAVTLLAFYRRRKKLLFSPVASRHSPQEAWEIVAEAAGTAGWTIAEGMPGVYMRIKTGWAEEEEVNTGELVTILFGQGLVLINSINDPDDWSYLYSGTASRGHAEWIETTLDKGLWKYDPEGKGEASQSEPGAAVALDKISAGDPPRYRFLRTKWGWELIAGAVVGPMAVIVRELDLFYEWLGSEIFPVVFFGLPALLCLIVLGLLVYSSRFIPVRMAGTDAEQYRTVLNALQEGEWHINYVREGEGIEARLPGTTPDEGSIAVFVFRNGDVCVNILKSADRPYPSFSISQRAAAHRWLTDVLHRREPERSVRAITPVGSGVAEVSAEGAENERPGDAVALTVMTSGGTPRLRLSGERSQAVFGLPLMLTILPLAAMALLLLNGSGISTFVVKTSAPFIAASFLLAAIRYGRLRFTEVPTLRTSAANYARSMEVCREAGWEILRTVPGMFIEAYRRSDEPAEEMITICFKGSVLYVNSINKLEDSRPSSRNNGEWTAARYSRRRNRENVERVIRGVTVG